MKGFLLDTNVISELLRPRPEPRVHGWVDATDDEILFLSVITLGEIRKGVAGLAPGRKRATLDAWLTYDLRDWFDGRILPVDTAVADRWGTILAECRKRGTPSPVIDGLLAATAWRHDLTVVTRNTAHFVAAGVSVFNPWAA